MSAEIPLAGSRALLVEDDGDLRDALTARLTKDGCRVAAASDGHAAPALLSHVPRPDVILLDLVMPRMDGWEFRAKQKADLAIAGIPVIALSADESAKAAAVDAVSYLRKPIVYEELRAAIVSAIR